ncbi:MAG TPA: cation:proton antiporter [Candidatus Acidoferrales bacterium]
MGASPTFFRDLAYVFLAAMAGGLLAWRLRQPIIIGYVVAGILISPLTPGPSVSDVHTLELFAEIGVILLMFSVGLEFSIKDLLRAKWVALLGGPLGILLLIALSLGAGSLLGWTPSQGIVVGATICVASTMVLTRLLLDQGQLRTDAGRVMVAITLVEDLAVVILIVLVPEFGRLEPSQFWALGRDLGRAVLILVPAFFVAAKVVPPLLKRVARTQRSEFFFIVVLGICMGTAALTQSMGLSLAFGAFAAGLMISGSDYAHEALAQLFPIRDALVALFFVTIGMLIDPRLLFSNVSVLGAMIALIIFGKLGVWTVVVRLFGYPIWTALTVAAGLTQIGEFSFILVQVARNAGIVGSDIYNATLAASLITILVNAAVMRYVPARLARLQTAGHMAAHARSHPETERLRNHVVLCGFGRVGSFIGTALETFGIPYTVIDIDPDVHSAVRERGIPTVFGDPAHAHILEKAGAAEASMVIITIPDADRARLAIQNVRRLNPHVPIVARAHRRSDHEVLVRAGATEVIQPEMEASATIIRHASYYLHVSDEQVRSYLRGFRKAMYSMEGKPQVSRVPFPEVRELTLVNGALAGRSLREARIREQFGVTVVSIARASGEALMNPPADTVMQSGDRLRVLGMSEELDAFTSQAAASRS